MKSILFIFTSLFLLLNSCEKVVDVKFDGEDQKVVIEGSVTDGESEHMVNVSKNLGLDKDGSIPKVNDAIVTLSDNFGNTQILSALGEGVYKASAFPAFAGRTYTLNVQVEGKNYQAVSRIPDFVALDSLVATSFALDDVSYTITPVFKDPAGVENFYMYRLFLGETRVSGTYLQSDQFIDGSINEQPIFSALFAGDTTVTVELMGIDKAVYKYFFALNQNATSTPANPVSNFSGGCLGYFMAKTKSVKSVFLP